MVEIDNSSPAPVQRKSRFKRSRSQSENLGTTELSIDDVVKSMKRVNTDFGLEGYQMPDNKGYLNIHRSTVIAKGKGELDFVTQHQKAKAWVPGFIYEVAKPLGNVKKNAFLKGRRVSMTDQIFKRESKLPGPGNYSPNPSRRLLGCYKSKSNRQGFTGQAEWKGLQTPGAVYDIKTTLIQRRVPEMKYYDTPKERFKQVKKSESPSPGAYGDIESYKKTQMRRMGNIISKYELPKMSEMKVKQRKYVPGVGHYNYEKAIDRISRSPPPKRRK